MASSTTRLARLLERRARAALGAHLARITFHPFRATAASLPHGAGPVLAGISASAYCTAMPSLPRVALLVALGSLSLAAPRHAAADTPKAAPPAANPVAAPPPVRPAPAAYQISAIRAFLYYHDTGTFDDRDAASGQMTLWNSIIGEGEAKAPSDATLVQVELSGPSFSNIAGALEIVVSAGKKKLVRQKLDAGSFFAEHSPRILIPVLVYDTGCDELQVAVTFTTPDRKKLKKSGVVPFACGE